MKMSYEDDDDDVEKLEIEEKAVLVLSSVIFNGRNIGNSRR